MVISSRDRCSICSSTSSPDRMIASFLSNTVVLCCTFITWSFSNRRWIGLVPRKADDESAAAEEQNSARSMQISRVMSITRKNFCCVNRLKVLLLRRCQFQQRCWQWFPTTYLRLASKTTQRRTLRLGSQRAQPFR
jgi:hypothetical protein